MEKIILNPASGELEYSRRETFERIVKLYEQYDKRPIVIPKIPENNNRIKHLKNMKSSDIKKYLRLYLLSERYVYSMNTNFSDFELKKYSKYKSKEESDTLHGTEFLKKIEKSPSKSHRSPKSKSPTYPSPKYLKNESVPLPQYDYGTTSVSYKFAEYFKNDVCSYTVDNFNDDDYLAVVGEPYLAMKYFTEARTLLVDEYQVEYCMNTKHRFICVDLTLHSDYYDEDHPLGIEDHPRGIEDHANVIIIDRKNMTYERFEPRGSGQEHDLYDTYYLDIILSKYFKKRGLKEKMNVCPSLSFQGHEIKEIEGTGVPGACLSWTWFYVYMRIKNPDYNQKKLQLKTLDYFKKNSIKLRSFIENFFSFIQD
jgi:hypothetical protein